MRIIVVVILLLTSSGLFAQKQSVLDVVEKIFRDSLKHDPKTDTVIFDQMKNNNQNAIVRERQSIMPGTRPLILINGMVIDNKSILDQIDIRDVRKIDILSDRSKTTALYGVRGIHGAVLITVGRKTEKRISKMNGGS